MAASPRDEVAAALGGLLARRSGSTGEVRGLQRLTAGGTKATWSFDWAVPGAPPQPLILQQTPPLGAAAGQVPKLSGLQEAALMQAARAAGTPAPVVEAVLAPEDGLGEGYVTRRVAGETLGPRILRDAAFAAARTRMAGQCGEILATIHRTPLGGLSFLQAFTPAQELAAYRALLEGCGVRHAALDHAMAWIGRHLPPPVAPALVHADFRTGNLVVGPDGVRCVLDWEIARIGDPMQDLGVLCMRTWRFGGPGEVGGFGAREALYAAYEAASGQRVDPQRVRFWEAFANLKWAIACARRGSQKRPDGRPASLELAAIGRRMEEPLWDFLNLVAPLEMAP
ncbi:MAG: phosphotransferase family protein [Pseudacidovorax sp.]|nr:phosphotransferase family protein [Pseudacidovorax sp.]